MVMLSECSGQSLGQGKAITKLYDVSFRKSRSGIDHVRSLSLTGGRARSSREFKRSKPQNGQRYKLSTRPRLQFQNFNICPLLILGILLYKCFEVWTFKLTSNAGSDQHSRISTLESFVSSRAEATRAAIQLCIYVCVSELHTVYRNAKILPFAVFQIMPPILVLWVSLWDSDDVFQFRSFCVLMNNLSEFISVVSTRSEEPSRTQGGRFFSDRIQSVSLFCGFPTPHT